MKYNFKGSLELRIPEDKVLHGEGDTKEEAILDMLKDMVDDGTILDYLNLDYLKVSSVRKVFKVTVTETFTHEVEVDTDDYPEIEDESDAEYYVQNNLEDFSDDFDYDEYSRDDISTDCSWCDTEEYESEC